MEPASRAWCGVLALLAACSASPRLEPDGGPPNDISCGPNLRPYKSACVPILDDCPESQVPVPGGGCKRVGVEACEVDGAPGIKGPPDWSCRPVGMVACKAAACNPRVCGQGWARGKLGWCEPVLPSAP